MKSAVTIIFKPLDKFLKNFKIFEIKRLFRRPLSLKIIVLLKGSKIRATIVLIFFIGSFVFTSESLSLFKGFDSNFHFHVNSSITNNAFEILLWTKI